MKRLTALLTLCCILLLPAVSLAGEIDFIEKFSLSLDGTEALKQLIPGTNDYYYYLFLH